MKSFISTPIRCFLALLISALFVAGCSSSSDSNSSESQTTADASSTNGNGVTSDEGSTGVANEMEDATTGDTTSGTQTESADGTDESTTGSGSESPGTTRVNVNITVPAYMSDALQVRLVWGDLDTAAVWNNDEFWTVSAAFPANTTNRLVVTFSDGNGAITLGSFEGSFTTGANQSESLRITADEFDTDRWDSDGDGVSNLSESIAGTNPQGSDALEPVQATLELVQDKTFRISWQLSEGTQFYRVFENLDGISGFTDVSGNLEATTTNFDHRVALFARVNAQYFVQSCNDQGCVDSDVLQVTGTLASAIGFFKASNSGQQDFFGFTLSLSADGNTLVVGAALEDSAATGINGNQSDNSASASGAVYVFTRSGGQWRQQAYLKASNTDLADEFGGSLSLSADGNTLAIGAMSERSVTTGVNGDQSDNSAFDSGAAYVFVRSGGLWQQQAYLKASNTGAGDEFGLTLSLSGDGNTLAVGADREGSAATGINGNQSDNMASTAGAVYVFTRSGGQWQQQAYLKASNTDLADEFGGSLSLSADGNILAVGAEKEDSVATGINGNQSDNSLSSSGAVYVFVRSGEQWRQQAYLKASNTQRVDLFGGSLSLSADGSTLAVGASYEDSAATGINSDQNYDSSANSGAVYVFVRSGGLWQQQAYIKASNTDEGDEFGGLNNKPNSVCLSADGTTLAVGAEKEDSAAIGINGDQSDNSLQDSGAVYLF